MAQANVTNVYNMGVLLFRDHIIRHAGIRDHLRDTLLELVARERRGEKIEGLKLLKCACQMLIALGIDANGNATRSVYVEVFEAPFLQQSREFYKASRGG